MRGALTGCCSLEPRVLASDQCSQSDPCDVKAAGTFRSVAPGTLTRHGEAHLKVSSSEAPHASAPPCDAPSLAENTATRSGSSDRGSASEMAAHSTPSMWMHTCRRQCRCKDLCAQVRCWQRPRQLSDARMQMLRTFVSTTGTWLSG